MAEICHRLDGLPLAIELAAARVRLLPPAGPAGAPGAPAAPADRRRPRPARPAADPARRRSPGATTCSPPDEQTLFTRLAVFAGGFSLEAAEAVGAGPAGAAAEDGLEVLDALSALVDGSLVEALESGAPGAPGGGADGEHGAGGEPRYRLLETVREYAAERLAERGEAPAVGARHAAHYLALAEAAAPALRSPHPEVALRALEREHDNLRAALRGARRRGDAATALGLASALWRFWEVRTHWTEGRAELEHALALAGGAAAPDLPARRAQVLLGAGALAYMQGDFAAARARFTEALSLCQALGDAGGRAWCLLYLGWMGTDTGQYAEARPLLEESLALHRRAGDAEGVIRALNVLGYGALFACDFAGARARCGEALALARRAGHRWGTAWSLRHLAITAIGERYLAPAAPGEADPGAARPLIEESLALYRALGDRHHAAMSLCALGLVAFADGDPGGARRAWAEVLAATAAHRDWILLPLTLTFLAALAAAQRDPVRAFRLMGSAAGMTQLGGPAAPLFVRLWEVWLAPARAALEGDAQARAWAEGQAMPPEQAVAYALEDAPAAA